jgi:hypothetical protein
MVFGAGVHKKNKAAVLPSVGTAFPRGNFHLLSSNQQAGMGKIIGQGGCRPQRAQADSR